MEGGVRMDAPTRWAGGSVMDAKEQRFITLWRKRSSALDWDFHVSESSDELDKLLANLQAQGIRQFSTYPIGTILPVPFSSVF